MASFTMFNIVYKELSDTTMGYEITYTINDPSPPANSAIEVLLWFNQIDYIVNGTSPIEISETARPQFFYQGIALRISLNYYDADNAVILATSSEYKGVLQRRTDTGECLVMTTPVYFTQLKPAANQFKSVILPPSPPPGTKFSFKITAYGPSPFIRRSSLQPIKVTNSDNKRMVLIK